MKKLKWKWKKTKRLKKSCNDKDFCFIEIVMLYLSCTGFYAIIGTKTEHVATRGDLD